MNPIPWAHGMRPATETQIIYVRALCQRHGLQVNDGILLSAEETTRWLDFHNHAGFT